MNISAADFISSKSDRKSYRPIKQALALNSLRSAAETVADRIILDSHEKLFSAELLAMKK